MFILNVKESVPNKKFVFDLSPEAEGIINGLQEVYMNYKKMTEGKKAGTKKTAVKPAKKPATKAPKGGRR